MTTCVKPADVPCYPYAPIQRTIIGGGGGGVCGLEQVRNTIGFFLREVRFCDLLTKWLKCTENADKLPVKGVSDGTNLYCIFDVITSLLILDSTAVQFSPTAQVNNTCTFNVRVPAFGRGASHWDKVPLYGNVVQQLPGISLSPSLTFPVSISNTLGQYNLQLNPFANAGIVFGHGLGNNPIALATIVPLLQRLIVEEGTPIYAGWL